MKELTLVMDSFEGPLDLLLHLIKELKIDIYDIPMVELTEQYLKYIHSMQELELEVAGDYLVMAATLLEIKARMLLPKPKIEYVEPEEELDPRQELVEKLIEYKKYQASAKELEKLSQERSSHYSRQGMELGSYQEVIPLREGELSTDDLWEALKRIARRSLMKQPIQANISHEKYTVEETMQYILKTLDKQPKGTISLEDCFPEVNRHAIVTTFLAMLQLVRDRTIEMVQLGTYEEIAIKKIDEKVK